MLHIAEKIIKGHEGLRLRLYKCSAGYWTIGYGRNLEQRGISLAEAEFMLANDLKECEEDLRTFPWWVGLSQARQAALMDMRLQLGASGLRNFQRMLAAIAGGDYESAAEEALDSKWAREDTPRRAQDIARMLREG